ncbi:LysR family transcriptional regulator [Paraburkholderia sp. GV068]|jgi:DNA-binding transcriptional LysR family regulator|uniref:DNA-binding transcriptional LysR family regulator n=1 Tax=Paraburkholderia graminis TaxID=60548 RepID=A0ABD5CRI7_9BURK|nr:MULTISPECIES: LysR family transcriptional regulator [Paraburkholderia]AXF10795.1 LysR family transcriptional regulator [Paraburkholderia graminis]MDQ0625324.1 DNA-binding transcriptional LysR family regulator [Paraburkholderia graminis]MDR6206482.1 DNA-binding transcriptional LysR family regulator [Paraburkholderia graminis]MDR6469970.1 DNA-binding transcriptional LysR family regulator [Paraburkholderia graminis]MDR6476023.1 DNA-binding transcriptional LysR family regulator [Paraburkholderi
MALTRVTIRQYEAFLAIVDLHSIGAAAERLGLTSSAVSQLLAELEAELGFRLFDRTTRRVNLSSAGQDFLASAESVLRHVRAAAQSADDIRNRAAGIVRIGAPLVLASTALPAAIADYARDKPKVVVRICDTVVEQLVERVESADVDLAIGPDRPSGARVRRDAAFASPWVMWCSPSHPLSARRRVQWQQLRDVPIVATGRDHERAVDQMLADLPVEARIVPADVVDNVTTAFGIASRGLAVTLAPAYVAPLARTFGLVMKRIVEPETIREVCLYRSTERALSPPAAGFADFLLPWLKRWDRETQADTRVKRG